MNRLTWGGHRAARRQASGLSRPRMAACACPLAFSELLLDVTHLGTPVIIAGATPTPGS